MFLSIQYAHFRTITRIQLTDICKKLNILITNWKHFFPTQTSQYGIIMNRPITFLIHITKENHHLIMKVRNIIYKDIGRLLYQYVPLPCYSFDLVIKIISSHKYINLNQRKLTTTVKIQHRLNNTQIPHNKIFIFRLNCMIGPLRLF